jgi:hypothetical protein
MAKMPSHWHGEPIHGMRAPDPTPEQIAAGTAEIRAAWSKRKHLDRAGVLSRHVEVQVVETAPELLAPREIWD